MESTTDKPKILSANLFPVVGIGASAGGLDAFKKMIKAIPDASGMAYIFVQHLDPTHESVLPELLQRITAIPIHEISDNIRVEPDNIYIIPSNKVMVATDGVLQLSPRPPKHQRSMPIDIFFSSLAEVHQTHAIGVVLSGTATDGTLGLKAIKDHGGITFAQDQKSAAYDGMPVSAVQAGVVDFILSPEKIPQKLIEIHNKINISDEGLEDIPPKEEEAYKQILSILRNRKGNDFTYYKQTTLRRRILRRMAINKSDEPFAYLAFLKENKAEQDVLYQDLLIPVTSFFRDNKVFDNLYETVFPKILNGKIAGEPIRIWVAGCSTGQEVYSIAICLKEFLETASPSAANGQTNAGLKVQIFATDISEPAITKARLGIYKKAEVEGLTPKRLEDFFTKTDGAYLVNKEVRDICVFAVHNFLKDPPFAKIDFVSCRNVLIYMEPYLQKKALTTFHYALSAKGVLMLGKSETISSVPDLFTVSSRQEKLFTRKDVRGRFMNTLNSRQEQKIPDNDKPIKPEKASNGFQKMADDILLAKLAPPGVIVNEALDIVYFRGDTSNYLQHAEGKASYNLLKMAKNGLAFELRILIHKAVKGNSVVSKASIPLLIEGFQSAVSIEAIPLANSVDPHYLILFYKNSSIGNSQSAINNNKTATRKPFKSKNGDRDLLLQQLEQELALTREDMRTITQDQEAANEELQSSNEELLSGSEELQSLNEELETSKEEVQSTNEELTIVNQEMISLNEQLSEARNYAEAIITTIKEPLLVLDKNLRIKTANKAFYKTFNVGEEETIGILFYELNNQQWNIPKLLTLLQNVLKEKNKFSDFEVKGIFTNSGERAMLLNAREMVDGRGLERFILLAFDDVTERLKLEVVKDELLSKFQNLVMQAPVAMCIFRGPKHLIELANESMLELWDRKAEQVLGKPVFESMPDLSGQGFEELLQRVIITGKRFTTPETPLSLLRNGKLETVFIKLVYEPLHEENGTITGVMALAYEITDQVLAKQKIAESEAFSRTILENTPDCVNILDEEGRLNFMNSNGQCLLDIDDFTKLQDKYWWELWGEENQPKIKEAITKAVNGERSQFQAFNPTVKGVPKWWDVIVLPLQEVGIGGDAKRIIAVSRDITAQKEVALKVEETYNRYNAMLMQSPFAFSILKGKDMVITLANDLMKEFLGKGNDVEGKTLLQVLPEVKDQPFPALLDSVYTTGKPVKANKILARLNYNGKLENRYFNIVYQPYVEADETISGVTVIAHEVTYQVEARKKIEESEYRYQNMIYSSPSLIAILKGEDYIISIANDAIIETWGKGKEVIGKPILKALPELLDQGIAEELEKVYTTGIPFRAIERPVSFVHNGKMELHYFSYIFQPQRTADNEIEGISVIGSEVTLQALANKKIKESEERFRLLVTQAPVAICILKGEEYLVEVANEFYLQMVGKGQDFIGKPIFESLPGVEAQGFRQLLDTVMQTGTPYYGNGVEVHIQRDDKAGQGFYNFVYHPIHENDETVTGIMVVVTEVTEQVLARKKMEAQAAMVSDLLMTAPGFVATLTGPDHVYGLINEQYQRLFGKRKLQGKAMLEALPELEGQGFNELLDKVYTTGESYMGIEIPIVLARDEDEDPELCYFNFSYQPMYDENKTIFSILVFGYEVTEQVLAKNKNIEDHEIYSSMLEVRVKDRTLELSEANEALNQKNEALIKMNAELESFTYISSHDLQEPLRKIQTFAARILDREYSVLSDTGKDYFQRMSNAAGRMQTLIQDLLVYSQTSIAERKLENTDLDKIVEEVKEEMTEAILEKGAVINAAKLGQATINPFQFRQILHNLVSNALKFSQPGTPPQIKIWSEINKGLNLQNEKLSPEKLYCHICFSDNGIGFDPQYKDKIFELFQRLHGKEAYAGTGIGLAIVKKIVENHSGIVTATGELGKGATFDIYLPAE